MSPIREPLAEDEVHVWLTRPAEVAEEAHRETLAALLTPEEHARRRRFLQEKDRHAFLVTRALARLTLSRYADVPPGDWRFEIGEHGKPEIATEHGSRLRFNLSHTRGMVACAVTLDRDVGVDVETKDRRTETTAIADRFFSAFEVDALRALPAEEQRARFFTYWALKESYIKARGLGLSIPLGSFSFHVDDGPPIRISFDPSLGDDPERWQFMQTWASDVHSLAVGVVRTGVDLSIRVRDVVPGADPLPG
ncbi:MAG: 4'-phosphopantetheinyl transferase superfamily protein [Planctomycetota bacterium]